jgi:3-methyladenine DNA glycosylase/8-oxoguanine DNA glycosylase
MPIGTHADRATESSQPSRFNLRYLGPYDWDGVLAFFRNHSLPFLESVDALGYERVFCTGQDLGCFRVTRPSLEDCLCLEIWNSSRENEVKITSSVRRMFDLDVSPSLVHKALRSEPYLSATWDEHPGLRVARAFASSESIFTTVLGQVVSVKFARVLIAELMAAAGPRVLHPRTGAPVHLFPTPEQILATDLSLVRTSQSRKTAILSLARLLAAGSLVPEVLITTAEIRKVLLTVPGIGAWTAEYIAMRGFHDSDAFPATDYGLKQELRRHPEIVMDRIRPFRAYAAVALWKSFARSKEGTS